MENLQEEDWPSLKSVKNVYCDSVKDIFGTLEKWGQIFMTPMESM